MSEHAMSAEEFIEKCNLKGSHTNAPRYRKTAADCNKMEDAPIPPFTEDGLAHLSALLSNKYSASGGKIPSETKAPYDPDYKWSEGGFLFIFNPKGTLKQNNPDFLKDFAIQIANGCSKYIPDYSEKLILNTKKNTVYPSKNDVDRAVKEIADNPDSEVPIDSVFDHVEENFIEAGRKLPVDWQKVTESKLEYWSQI